MVQVIKLFSKEMLTLLLDLRRDNVLITEEVVKAAVGNGVSSKGIIILLLN